MIPETHHEANASTMREIERIPHELTEVQRELLALLADLGPSPSGTLLSTLREPISYPALMRNLGQLLSFGLVERMGSARNAGWRLLGPPRSSGSPLPAPPLDQAS